MPTELRAALRDAAAMLDSYSEIGFYSDAAKARAKVAEFRALADAPPTVAELLPMVDATHEAWWQSASAPDVTLRARLDTVRGIVFEARLDDRSAWVAICALPIMARPHASGHVLTAAGDDLRAAIAADKAALDDTWRAHDLERDAEVAQAQAATHEACAALQAICAALHVAPPTGSTYCTEAVAMVLERVAADRARAVEAGISAAFATLLPGRPTPDEARRLVEEAIGAGMALACHGDWSDEQRAVDRAHADAARTALLRALGVEA